MINADNIGREVKPPFLFEVEPLVGLVIPIIFAAAYLQMTALQII